jgi:hypothetical protein
MSLNPKQKNREANGLHVPAKKNPPVIHVALGAIQKPTARLWLNSILPRRSYFRHSLTGSISISLLRFQTTNLDGQAGIEPARNGVQSPAPYLLGDCPKNLGWPSWIRTRHSTFKESRDAASLTANISKIWLREQDSTL